LIALLFLIIICIRFIRCDVFHREDALSEHLEELGLAESFLKHLHVSEDFLNFDREEAFIIYHGANFPQQMRRLMVLVFFGVFLIFL
jgi:hypothetical protein